MTSLIIENKEIIIIVMACIISGLITQNENEIFRQIKTYDFQN